MKSLRKNRITWFVLWGILCSSLLCACGWKREENSKVIAKESFVDALGRSISIEKPQRVISLYGSFAETWMLAGGSLVGTTVDAVEERNLSLPAQTEIIGTVKNPDMERLVALEPDFVLLSADIASHVEMAEMLETLQIPHAYFRVDHYQDYLSMLEFFCRLTERSDLYEQNGLGVKEKIEKVLRRAGEHQEHPSVLLIRAFSTGAKAKGADNLAGMMLKDLGADNIVERHDSLLENLSIEAIIEEDPDFIFVSIMGNDEKKALAALKADVESNPAWEGLSAIQKGNYILLPKELFHYKPNAKWGESYEYLARILYPETAK